jgi:hypothetical protein
MVALRTIRAVLGFRKRKANVVLWRSKEIHAGLAGRPDLFASPSPPLSQLQGLVEALDAAQVAVQLGGHGAAAARDVTLTELWTCLELLLKYVQSLVAKCSEDEAVALILAAGMKVANAPVHDKRVIEVRQRQSGTVELFAFVALLRREKGSRSRKINFNWRYTLNGGESWVPLPSTPVGNIVVSGLPPLTEVGFSVSITDADGPGRWCDTVPFLVH